MLKNLRKLREEKGVTQKQLADIISVSQQSINKYENHNIEPDIDTLIKMADYFETSVDYIVGHSKIRRKIEIVNSYDLNAEEAKLVEDYRKLSNKQRFSIALILENYTDIQK
ncbi:MAG: helix-turn-helix transcriptional regulator [Christensenellaceae bacterium]|mgnify:FL=1